jgi:cholesterol transport system auxiliary component
LPPLALADVDAPGLPEGSNAVLYRLMYADTQQLRPYSQARWSQPPAQLVQQRLREQLGQRRAILKADDAAAQARDPAQGSRLPSVLRVELEEFSHVFTSATDSAGVVRLRATVVDLTLSGEALRGQRVFIVRTPARSADAAGGVAALSDASTQVAQELSQWLEQVADARP